MRTRFSTAAIAFPRVSRDSRPKSSRTARVSVFPNPAGVNGSLNGSHTHGDWCSLFERSSVRAGDETRALSVYSVQEVAGHRWFQLGVAGLPERPLVLAMAPTASLADAIDAIEAWLECPFDTGNVVRVE
jgi:hypothetical protein